MKSKLQVLMSSIAEVRAEKAQKQSAGAGLFSYLPDSVLNHKNNQKPSERAYSSSNNNSKYGSRAKSQLSDQNSFKNAASSQWRQKGTSPLPQRGSERDSKMRSVSPDRGYGSPSALRNGYKSQLND